MQITGIDQQLKNKDRYNIFIDNKFVCGLHVEVIVKNQIKKGLTVSADQIAAWQTDDAFYQAYDKALAYLARRPRSTHETRQYLRDKLIFKHPDLTNFVDQQEKEAFISRQHQNIDKIIDQLSQRHYLDDVAFAKWWISNRQQFKPRGKRLLLLELKTKGVSNQDIHTALTTPSEEGHFTSEHIEFNEKDTALKLAKQRLKKMNTLQPQEQKQKLSRYLASKGYEWELINEITNELIKNE